MHRSLLYSLMIILSCLWLSFGEISKALTRDSINRAQVQIYSLVNNKLLLGRSPIVGGINLQAVLNNMIKIEFYKESGGTPIGSCGRRMGYLNSHQKSMVVIPVGYFKNYLPEDIFNTLIFHEICGALGVFDENYGFSVGVLWLASQSKEIQDLLLPKDLMSMAADSTQEVMQCSTDLLNLAEGGGSTGTGSGGDPLAIHIKMDLMDFFKAQYLASAKAPSDQQKLLSYLIAVLRLPLEADFRALLAYVNNDKAAYLQAISMAAHNPVVFSRTSSGGWQARYAFMKMSPTQRAIVVKLIATRMTQIDWSSTK